MSQRILVSPSIKPSDVIRKQKPAKFTSHWNAMNSRRNELGLNRVIVTTKQRREVV